MKKEFSIYLDLVRFLAALAVVIYHSNMRNIIEANLPFSQHGHAARIVFFVLSGYVISYIVASQPLLQFFAALINGEIRRGLVALTQSSWWRNGVSPMLAPGQTGR